MVNQMLIIDPLKLKIQELLINGSFRPFQDANNGFITITDIEKIKAEFLNLKHETRDFRHFIYIDITPYQRFTNIDEFIIEFNKFQEIRPVLLINTFLEKIINSLYPDNNCPICFLVFDKNRNLILEHYSTNENDTLNKVFIKIDFYTKKTPKKSRCISYKEFRTEIANELLTRLLYKNGCIEIPAEFSNKTTIATLAGQYYFSMVNGMLVSCYLNLKKFGDDNSSLVDIAYEVIMELFDYFAEKKENPLDSFDLFVTANNTALFLSSTIQAILHKPIIPIDKLGPIPSLKIRSKSLKETIRKKRIILLEEVIATGSEVDRTVMFLNNAEAEVVKILGIYNLDIGKPLLANKIILTSLCRPKEEINYVYRSK